MPILAGQTVKAAELGRIQSVPYLAAATSETAALGNTTLVDVPGATVTLTTTVANARYQVTGTFDMLPGANHASILAFGFLVIDGTADSGVAIQGLSGANRSTVSQTWGGTLAAAGSHTLKLAASLSGTLAGGVTVRAQNSKISITIMEVV